MEAMFNLLWYIGESMIRNFPIDTDPLYTKNVEFVVWHHNQHLYTTLRQLHF